MPCTNCGGDKRTYLANGDGISFSGAGTYASPYIPHLANSSGGLAFEVRDSDTINFTLYGSGLPGDPLILTGDTSSATRLATLGDVAANPGPQQGRGPMWIGTPGGGHFELRTPGTRYTTHATRGDGLYQGEVIRETDTGDRLEWDGTQWVSLVPNSIAPSALDPSVLQSKGTLDSSTDWNTLVNGSGIYRIGNGVSSSNNAPAGAYGFGTLEVVKSGNSVTQRYNAHQQGAVYTRTKWNDTDWRPWDSAATAGTVQAEANARANGDNSLQNQINAEATTRSQQDNALSTRIDQARAEAANQRVYGTSGAGKMASGNVLVSSFTRDSNTNNYVGYVDIGLPSGSSQFNGNPNVTATAQSADSGGTVASVIMTSPTQFRVYVIRRNNVATGVNWIAVGN